MNVIVVGGSGLIGQLLQKKLNENGHQVASVSRNTGVDAVTGQGLKDALTGADVVVDVLNSPSFEAAAVLEFFQKTSRNLADAEAAAGVKHHIALSVVGADRMPDSGYMPAKVAQEQTIQSSGIPYTILRATQFFEFLSSIAEGSTVDGKVVVPATQFQPVAAEDVAATLSQLVTAAPANAIRNLAGPEAMPMRDFLEKFLRARGSQQPVVTSPTARYFSTLLTDNELVPMGPPDFTGSLSLDRWLQSR